MTYQEIYTAALRLICEDEGSIADDYEARAPFLLATFVTEQIPLQKKWDATHGEEETEYRSCLAVTMQESFPLAEEFIVPATYYLAAMLALDENEVLSDHFFDRYADGVASIEASLPASSEKIKDCYHELI